MFTRSIGVSGGAGVEEDAGSRLDVVDGEASGASCLDGETALLEDVAEGVERELEGGEALHPVDDGVRG